MRLLECVVALRPLGRRLHELTVGVENHDLAAPLAVGQVWVSARTAQPVDGLLDCEDTKLFANREPMSLHTRVSRIIEGMELPEHTEEQLAAGAENADRCGVVGVLREHVWDVGVVVVCGEYDAHG